MADVFISYSRTDEPAARRLADAVKRLGHSVWWDEELPAHLSYGDVIAEQIGSARAAIVIWSEQAAASQWVRAEADAARNQKKLIQASIDDRMPPMPFNQLHFVSIRDWRGEADHPGWRKIQESLAALCGAAQAGPPADPVPPAAPPAAPGPPHKWHKLLIAVIALSFLAIAAAGLFAWLRGGEGGVPVNAVAGPDVPVSPSSEPAVAGGILPAEPAAPPETTRPAAPPPPARTAAAGPRAQPRAPANMRAGGRYCTGRGRGTSECRRLRAQSGR